MIDPAETLRVQNTRALDRRDAFRAEVASGAAGAMEFQTLKHEFPFMGFVECEAEGIPFVMFSCNDDVVAWEYFWRGTYEPEIVAQWVAWAKEATSILDIGAYTGLMSVLAARANPEARIHALEPVERTVERLKINLRANGVADRVTAHTKAAAGDYGIDMINYYRDEDFLGTGNSLHDKGKKIAARRMIQTVNVDHYLGAKHKFDLVKIDVEGFEAEVLKGITRLIQRDRPRMVIEIWKENRSHVTRKLESLGYCLRPVEREDNRVVNYFCNPANSATA